MYFPIEVDIARFLGHVCLEDFLNWDEFFYRRFYTHGKSPRELFIAYIFALFIVKNVRIFVEVLRSIIVTCLNENFVGWKTQTDFLVIRFEANSRKNFRTRDENGR